jgi:hypothetical protein
MKIEKELPALEEQHRNLAEERKIREEQYEKLEMEVRNKTSILRREKDDLNMELVPFVNQK